MISRDAWQVRAALLDDGHLQDIYFDAHSTVDLERSFFKGKISKVIPGLQTSFVEIGQEKAGFLHISEVDRVLAADRIAKSQRVEGEDSPTYDVRSVKKVMDMAKVFKEGEYALVQVIKEPVYEKGAKLTTCFTLPGKFIVLMPNIAQIGVSKKIENRDERQRLRDVLRSALPKGMGAIVRTTSENRSIRDLRKDVAFLVSLWHSIQKKFKTANEGDCLFNDLPLPLRVLREHLSEDIKQIIVNTKQDYDSVKAYVSNLMPEMTDRIILYKDRKPLFEKYRVEEQLHAALQRKVNLKSGGTLIIESTEAMTVIDVNTGRFTGGSGRMEETILKTNLEAAEETVRQLRLRNIGGLIVIDFIDMASQGHRQKLSSMLEKHLKEKDRFQSVTLKVSEFGLVQMTRKRSGKTLVQQLTQDCPTCHSLGHVPSLVTIAHDLFKQCRDKVVRERLAGPYLFVLSVDVFHHMVRSEYQAILALEKELGNRIVLELDTKLKDDEFRIEKAT